jgi:hypothetical protein
VHIVSGQKGSGCPGVEVEVDVPATEREKGGGELETDREWISGAALSDRVLSCREEVPPVLTFFPGLVYQLKAPRGISNSLANCSIRP